MKQRCDCNRSNTTRYGSYRFDTVGIKWLVDITYRFSVFDSSSHIDKNLLRHWNSTRWHRLNIHKRLIDQIDNSGCRHDNICLVKIITHTFLITRSIETMDGCTTTHRSDSKRFPKKIALSQHHYLLPGKITEIIKIQNLHDRLRSSRKKSSSSHNRTPKLLSSQPIKIFGSVHRLKNFRLIGL